MNSTTNWGATLNANFHAIDAEMRAQDEAALLTTISDTIKDELADQCVFYPEYTHEQLPNGIMDAEVIPGTKRYKPGHEPRPSEDYFRIDGSVSVGSIADAILETLRARGALR